MNNYKEIEGDLIDLALKGEFDVIAHGCNCFCTQKSGIAKQMAEVFKTDYYILENDNKYKGDLNKLGQIEYYPYKIKGEKAVVVGHSKIADFFVVNAYTQYRYGKNHEDGDEKPLDYEALKLCLRKINHIFKGKHIGLPGLIGCGLAGGDEKIVKKIIKEELKDCNITICYLHK